MDQSSYFPEAASSGEPSQNESGFCPVCRVMQASLPEHMNQHSKNDLIKAISSVHTPKKILRCIVRKSSDAETRNIQPTVACPSYIIPVSNNNDTNSNHLPSLLNDRHSMQVLQPTNNNSMPIQNNSQTQYPTQGNNIIFVGNSLVPTPQGLMPNNNHNFQMPPNAISYIIPSNNQALFVPQITNGVQPIIPNNQVIIPNSNESDKVSPLNNNGNTSSQSTPSTSQGHSSFVKNGQDNKTTVQVGNNISITIPNDLVGKKDRIKELINQELVRALLINDTEKESEQCNNDIETSDDDNLKHEPDNCDQPDIKKDSNSFQNVTMPNSLSSEERNHLNFFQSSNETMNNDNVDRNDLVNSRHLSPSKSRLIGKDSSILSCSPINAKRTYSNPKKSHKNIGESSTSNVDNRPSYVFNSDNTVSLVNKANSNQINLASPTASSSNYRSETADLTHYIHEITDYGEEQILGAVEEVFSDPLVENQTVYFKKENDSNSSDTKTFGSTSFKIKDIATMESTSKKQHSSIHHSKSLQDKSKSGSLSKLISNRLDKLCSQDASEELNDDPTSEVEFSSSFFSPPEVFECDLSGSGQHEEAMSLKASESLADSDSEHGSPTPQEISDLFFSRNGTFVEDGEDQRMEHRPIDYFSQTEPSPYIQMHNQNEEVHPNGQSFVTLTSSDPLGHYGIDPSLDQPAEDTLNLNFDPASCSILTTETFNQLFIPISSEQVIDAEMKIENCKTPTQSSSNLTASQLSPEPSTSGLQTQQAQLSPLKNMLSDDEYEFEYESDRYGDSDSDYNINKTEDLEVWKCPICNKAFKSLKEKLLHAGQHSPPSFTEENEMESKICVKQEDSKAELSSDSMFMGTAVMMKNCLVNDVYKCIECGEEFSSIDALFIHRRNVFKSTLNCQICHMKFTKRAERIAHMNMHPTDLLECVVCNRKFQNRYSWNRHQMSHLGLVKYECKDCGRGFLKESEYVIHMRKHTGERPYKCQTCKKCFMTSQALKRHVFMHMEGTEVDCDICHKTFKNMLCLQRHIQVIHQKKKNKMKREYLCSACDEVFSTVKKLLWHQEIHERWPKKCNQCGECFIHKSSLTKHIRQVHNPQYTTIDGKAENNATCDVCNKIFKKSSLAQHMRTHSGDKPFKCDICSKTFSVKCNLEAHKWVHMGIRDRPYKCKLCDRSFNRPKSLEGHIRSHKNLRPYTCNECGKAFIHKNNLRLHVKEHTGKKEHVCDECGKAFFRKYNLTNHIRVHSKETPYVCAICGKKFSQKSNYNVHMKTFHVLRQTVHEEI